MRGKKEVPDKVIERIKKRTNEPLVTVVIPCWGKYVEYLPRCIMSVKKQTHQNFEIMIANVASATRGCNMGWEAANGKYIAFLGADDIWYPEKLEKQVAFMEAHKDIQLCTCWSEDNRFNTKRISKAKIQMNHEDILKAFNYSSGSTYMIRNNTDLRFDEELLSGQEYDLALRLTTSWKYARCIEEVLVKQYSTPGQISTDWNKKVRGIWQLAKKHGEEYSMVDWMKVVGLLGLYTFGYIFGTGIYKFITIAKEHYE